tara:strand:- start:481 stop:1104 length:624 start_codon:yes stop_codon:yes gene_type:complete
MNYNIIFKCLEEIKKNIDLHKDEIEKLDQEIGDGDHIFNIQRGIKEAMQMKNELVSENPKNIFKKIGFKIMTTIGGSSGALFATLLLGMSKSFSEKVDNRENLIKMFAAGVEDMKKRGKANIGEKTMLDVLIPVSEFLQNYKENSNNSDLAKEVKAIANEGMLSTKNMVATKGRASFLGERAKGHIDPGARSSQLAIEAICNQFIIK